jgi:putative hemolysin
MKSKYNLIKSLGIFILCLLAVNLHASTLDDYTQYCGNAGGVVELMTPEFSTPQGMVTGQPKRFCNFTVDNGFIAIGLETFASDKPSIAATYIKKMRTIKSNSPLWKGIYSNPSHNVCKNIGGAAIGFITSGGFANALGQTDICVFGDGSMVSGWSLIYMANHRNGYARVKEQLHAEPLNIPVP